MLPMASKKPSQLQTSTKLAKSATVAIDVDHVIGLAEREAENVLSWAQDNGDKEGIAEGKEAIAAVALAKPLIAAAPELLEAAKQVIDLRYQNDSDQARIRGLFRVAIAKATGEK
jgi:hypothetical protein